MGEPQAKVALLAGGSGLTGNHLLGALLEAPDFARTYAVTRRPLGLEHPKLANRIVQFDRLEAQLKGIVCHTAFCCLGASARGAGSEAARRGVELGYAVAFARAAKAAQAQRFVLLSCVGALSESHDSRLRVKQEAEQSIEALGFTSLDILQPGPLIGLRREMPPSELLRLLVVPAVSLLQLGAREAYRGISARTVAAAMLSASRSGRRGVYRYTYSGIRALASAKYRVSPARSDVVTSKSSQPPT